MRASRRFNTRILCIAALVAVSGLAAYQPAVAACSSSAPSTGETVICSGTSAPVAAAPGSTGVTVTLDPTATLDAGAADGVTVRDGSTVTLDGTTSPLAGADIFLDSGSDAGHAGIVAGGDGNSIVMKGKSLVNGQGDNDDGIVLSGDDNDISMTESAYIWAGRNGITATGDRNTIGLGGGANIVSFTGAGISLDGTSNDITLGDDAYIATYFFADGQKAVEMDGGGNRLTLNGAARLVAYGSDATLVLATGDGNEIALNDQAALSLEDGKGIAIEGNDNHVSMSGDSSVTVNVGGTGLSLVGDDNTATLDGNALLLSYGTESFTGVDMLGSGNALTVGGNAVIGSYAGANSAGVHVSGTDNAVTLEDAGSISTFGDDTPGIDIEGDANRVSLDDDSTISTGGFASHGVAVDGDDNEVDLDGHASITVNSGGGAQGVYLSGDGNAVGLKGSSSITVNDFGVYGVLAEGDGNTVTIADDAAIVTHGQSSDGVYLYGTGNELDMTGGRIGTTGNFGWGVWLGGGGNTIDMSGNASVVTGTEAGYGYFAHGLVAYDGGNTIAMTDDARVETMQSNAHGLYLSAGNGDKVTMDGASSVVTDGFGSDGIRVEGNETGIEMSGDASISTSGFAGVGIYYIGNGAEISLSDAAAVLAGSGDGIVIEGDGGRISIGDDAVVSGIFNGIRAVGSDTRVEIGGNAEVIGTYDGAYSVSISGSGELRATDRAKLAGGVYLAGDGTISFSEDASLRADADGATGVSIQSGSVALRDRSSVAMAGDGATAIYAGDGTSISIDRNASILMTGAGATGIRGQYGVQTVSIAGILDAGGGTAIDLGDGNDALTLETGARITGLVDGGDDTDSLTLRGEGIAASDFVDFETLTVEADGIWNLTGDVTLGSTGTTDIASGTLRVNGALTSPGGVTVASGAVLGGAGTIFGDIVNRGTISPGNSPGTLTVVGNLSFDPGSLFHVEITPTAADLLDVQGAVTIAGGAIETDLQGVDGGAFTVLTASGGISGRFAPTSGFGYSYGPNSLTLLIANPSVVNASVGGGANAGFAFLDSVLTQAGRERGLWAAAIREDDRREGMAGSAGFDQTTRGGAIGGDVWSDGGAYLGLAAGYLDADAEVAGSASKAGIEAWQSALYAGCRCGFIFVDGALSAGYQDQDTTRHALVGATTETVKGTPSYWTYGAAMKVGHAFELGHAWAFVPTANLAWQQLEGGAYSETGGGVAALSLDDRRTGLLRAVIDGKLTMSARDPLAAWALTPFLHAGFGREWRTGDGEATGRFGDGTAYLADLDRRDQNILVAGGGLDYAFGSGIALFVRYDGRFGEVEDRKLFTAGMRLVW